MQMSEKPGISLKTKVMHFIDLLFCSSETVRPDILRSRFRTASVTYDRTITVLRHDTMIRSLLVVDDHLMTRAGLRALTQTGPLADVCWIEASTLAEALDSYRRQSPPPDLVLLDLKLPDSLGLNGLRRFLAEHPHARIAVFSATEDRCIMQQALALGAIGFVPKTINAEDVRAQIAGLLERASDRARPAAGSAGGPDVSNLTATQFDVLELVLGGLSNQQIASELGLALGTVKNAVSSIMLKFDVQSRQHLISLFR